MVLILKFHRYFLFPKKVSQFLHYFIKSCFTWKIPRAFLIFFHFLICDRNVLPINPANILPSKFLYRPQTPRSPKVLQKIDLTHPNLGKLKILFWFFCPFIQKPSKSIPALSQRNALCNTKNGLAMFRKKTADTPFVREYCPLL